MKPESIPYYAIFLGIVLGVCWFVDTRDGHTFEEPEPEQFCHPQVQEGQLRWGRDVALLEPDDLEPQMLVRYRTSRTLKKVITSRIVATQGQRVKIVEGKVYVNGDKIKEPYVQRPGKRDNLPELIVPEGCVFVLNDQRGRGGGERMDSRTFGPIPVRSVELCFDPKEPE